LLCGYCTRWRPNYWGLVPSGLQKLW
jgi:hypothetical protein